MHRKVSMRNLIVTCLVCALVLAGITVLVLAASDDSEATNIPATVLKAPANSTANNQKVSESATLTLQPKDSPAAEIRQIYSDEVIKHETLYVEDDTLRQGVEVYGEKGTDGVIRHITEIVMHDGVEVSRQYGGSVVLVEPKHRIIRIGTYQPPLVYQKPAPSSSLSESAVTTFAANYGTGPYDETRNMLSSVTIDPVNKTITTPSGEVFNYSNSFVGEATAYSCEGYANPITYSGTPAKVGVVAVDPKFIPLGSRLFIMLSDGSLIYGFCVAEDTGGAVKGNIIDLYMNTYADCALIGRSPCDVYVLS